MEPCFLVLEDGTVFPGKGFGHIPPLAAELKNEDADLHKKPAGEVVFNTGMAGYHEILTDPSYSGQIIVMTYPHIGNYGTDEEWTEFGPGEGENHTRLKACGMVVRSLYEGPIPNGRESLDSFMKKYKTPGISEIDTRRLTLKIRSGGSLRGIIIRANEKALSEKDLTSCLDYLKDFPVMEGRNLVSELGAKKVIYLNEKGKTHISLVDCGTKKNIYQELVKLDCKVSLVPNNITPEELLKLNQDAILFSNGPGDPSVLTNLITLAKEVIGKKPVFGICLGHQIISLALGATTFKMKFGHHGVNNPVRDEETKKVQVTSQNHGFSVKEDSLPSNCKVRFRNVNDNTVEGISAPDLPVLTAQFHPEAAPGPRDSHWIFKEFLKLI